MSYNIIYHNIRIAQGSRLSILVFIAFIYFSYGIKDPHSDEFSFFKCIIFASGAFTFARSWSVTPEYGASRIAFLTVVIGGVFIFWHWEAMLISYLATRVIVLPFESLDELVEKSDYNIMIIPGSYYEDVFKEAEPGTLFKRAYPTKIQPYLGKLLMSTFLPLKHMI